MDFDKLVKEWFYRLPKGYADAPYSQEELAVLDEVMTEQGVSLPEAELEKEKFTEPDQMRNEVDQLDQAFNDAKPVEDLDEELIEASNFLNEVEDEGLLDKLYSIAEEQDKSDQFGTFIETLPEGLPKAATIKHLTSLSDDDKLKFIKDGWNTNTIPNGWTIKSPLEIGIFRIDAKGIGKGEVYGMWKFRGAVAQGGDKSYDLMLDNIKYEVKDYSGEKAKEGKEEKLNKKSIRVGVEGTVSKFQVWKYILLTVNMLEKIPEEKFDLLPGAATDSPLHDKWKELKRIRDYIIKRVAQDVKIVTGEFNTTDTKEFKNFYFTLNELLATLGDEEEFNQLVAYGPNQKPLSLVIDPVSLQDMSKTGEITIKVQTSGYDAKPTTLINYFKKLPYISSTGSPERGPEKFDRDLNKAVEKIIKQGEADYWLVFRGTASNIIAKVISKDRAEEFKYVAISQGGVKFLEPDESDSDLEEG